MNFKEYKLNNFNSEEFLEKYWQKKPCLIKQGLANFKSIISPNELAGLACEDGVYSRAVTGHKDLNNWTLNEGPFNNTFFDKFPNEKSTLLVQKVDHLVSEVADLRSLFSFIPTWRFDDVMISYAEDQGSVGPHIDNYDVFLLQGMGKRLWQLEDSPITEEEELISGCDLRVLKFFNPNLEWVLEPGDILYIPPRYAHHGISIGKGMTYSFGFRSPSISEITLGVGEHYFNCHTEKDRYIDPDLKLSNNPQKIDKNLINRVKKQLIETIKNDQEAHIWLGKLITTNQNQPNDDDLDDFQQISIKEAGSILNEENAILEKSDEVKWAYHYENNSLHVFIHGNIFELPAEDILFIETLFSKDRIELSKIQPYLKESSKRKKVLQKWIFNGYLIFS